MLARAAYKAARQRLRASPRQLRPRTLCTSAAYSEWLSSAWHAWQTSQDVTLLRSAIDRAATGDAAATFEAVLRHPETLSQLQADGTSGEIADIIARVCIVAMYDPDTPKPLQDVQSRSAAAQLGQALTGIYQAADATAHGAKATLAQAIAACGMFSDEPAARTTAQADSIADAVRQALAALVEAVPEDYSKEDEITTAIAANAELDAHAGAVLNWALVAVCADHPAEVSWASLDTTVAHYLCIEDTHTELGGAPPAMLAPGIAGLGLRLLQALESSHLQQAAATTLFYAPRMCAANDDLAEHISGLLQQCADVLLCTALLAEPGAPPADLSAAHNAARWQAERIQAIAAADSASPGQADAPLCLAAANMCSLLALSRASLQPEAASTLDHCNAAIRCAAGNPSASRAISWFLACAALSAASDDAPAGWTDAWASAARAWVASSLRGQCTTDAYRSLRALLGSPEELRAAVSAQAWANMLHQVQTGATCTVDDQEIPTAMDAAIWWLYQPVRLGSGDAAGEADEGAIASRPPAADLLASLCGAHPDPEQAMPVLQACVHDARADAPARASAAVLAQALGQAPPSDVVWSDMDGVPAYISAMLSIKRSTSEPGQ